MVKVADRGISIVSGKNVSLVGFGKLAKTEIDVVKEIMNTHLRKLEERTDYQELKIRLKQHQHAKSFKNEIKAELLIHPGMSRAARCTHKNIYRALAQVMIKLVSSIEHLKKKSTRGKVVRKITRRL